MIPLPEGMPCWPVDRQIQLPLLWEQVGLGPLIEHLADVASPDFHPLVGRAKDVAAGAVLVAALGSVAIGLLILGPHFLGLLRGGA